MRSQTRTRVAFEQHHNTFSVQIKTRHLYDKVLILNFKTNFQRRDYFFYTKTNRNHVI